MEWISVKEKMPNISKIHPSYSVTVVFKTKDGDEFTGWFRFDFEEWIVKDKKIAIEAVTVTHWQPLPKEPKG